MKTTALVLLSCLLAPLGARTHIQEEQEQGAPPKKVPAARARGLGMLSDVLTKTVQGAWMLFDYTDPTDVVVDGAASGFATFHDGFMTLMLSMDTVEQRIFHTRDHLVLDAGAYRFRFDEQGMLQLSSVLSFTNQTELGEIERERTGQAYEYYAQVDDGVLSLRDPDGVTYSFRRVEAREFPESAVRKLEGRRSGTPQWEEQKDDPKEPR